MQNPLAELQEYEHLLEALKKGQGPIQATGTLDSQKVHLMYELKEDASYPCITDTILTVTVWNIRENSRKKRGLRCRFQTCP